MKKYTINYGQSNVVVKSEAAMWTHLREIRDSLLKFYQDGLAMGETPSLCTDHATATAEDGTLYKDIEFRLVKGKIQMVNHVKETCRYAKVKAAKLAAAAKAEAKKAKKREADRRYREKKKAAKAAAAALKAETPTA